MAAFCAGCSLAQNGGIRVIAIGVDGLSVDAVSRANVPHMRRLIERGAWTLEARGVMPTLSSPNWASMLGGAGPEQHGITSNGYLRRMVEFRPVCSGREGKFPTIFEVLRSQRPSSGIAVLHDWKGLAGLIEKSAPDVIRHERGAARTTEAAIRHWTAARPVLMFVHLDNADHAGHSHGWGSAPYHRSVEEADRLVGALVEMVAMAGETANTYVLVTSDHGGTPRGHGKNSLAEIQIPWILAGPGVAKGRIGAPVNTFDTAATLAWILDVSPPECWIGRQVRQAFLPATLAARERRNRGLAAGCPSEPPQRGALAAAHVAGAEAAPPAVAAR